MFLLQHLPPRPPSIRQKFTEIQEARPRGWPSFAKLCMTSSGRGGTQSEKFVPLFIFAGLNDARPGRKPGRRPRRLGVIDGTAGVREIRARCQTQGDTSVLAQEGGRRTRPSRLCVCWGSLGGCLFPRKPPPPPAVEGAGDSQWLSWLGVRWLRGERFPPRIVFPCPGGAGSGRVCGEVVRGHLATTQHPLFR